ncbi:cohesin subunit sa-1 [Hordeum vulgare]|nr:cohesin subunit sa-1 [Hordeum vulgare]
MVMDKGKEVVPPLDKGKEVVPPLVEEPVHDHPSPKRRNYGHYHQESKPSHFCKVILAPNLESLPLPVDFTKYFPTFPVEFKLKMNTSCAWRATARLMNGTITCDQGWDTFVAVHHILIGYMLTFKLLTLDTMKVIVFHDDVYGEISVHLKRMEVMEAKERLPKETKGKTKEKNQTWDEVQSVLKKEEVEEVAFLQPYLHLLSPSLIELLRFCETTRTRNTYLTREVVLLEKHITDLQAMLMHKIPSNGARNSCVDGTRNPSAAATP